MTAVWVNSMDGWWECKVTRKSLDRTSTTISIVTCIFTIVRFIIRYHIQLSQLIDIHFRPGSPQPSTVYTNISTALWLREVNDFEMNDLEMELHWFQTNWNWFHVHCHHCHHLALSLHQQYAFDYHFSYCWWIAFLWFWFWFWFWLIS